MRLLLAFFLLVLGIACSADQEKTPAGKNPSAIDFNPTLPWLNVSRPLTLKDLKGKVVILDFWTYGCINCIHVLEDLRKLENKYTNQLAVIGVHSPKFDNEKNIESLRNIIVRYDIEHPVVNDVDFSIGMIYGMRAWPTQVVIDPAGGVLGAVRGEGNYELLDDVIEKLIKEHKDEMITTPLPIALEKTRLEKSVLAAPGKIAVSNQYVAISDTLHHRIVLANHKGKIQKIFGGNTPGFINGATDTVRFRSPQGLEFSEQGLFVADTGNHAIRYIDLLKSEVKTIAGNGKNEIHRFGTFDALSIGLRSPWGLSLRDSDLYIAMAGMHQIWRLNLKTGEISAYAGSSREGIRNGTLFSARFSQPSDLSFSGNWLYVADTEDSSVRRINIRKKQVETLVGTGLFDFGDRDGSFSEAELQHVSDVVVLNPTTLLVADTYNHKLKMLDLDKREVKTLAGTGQPGKSNGKGVEALMNEPGGLAILNNSVLIADTNNNRIVEYNLETQQLNEWPLEDES